MKSTAKFSTVVSLLGLVVAGCAHKAQYSNYDQSYSSPSYGGNTTYENRSTYNNSRTYSPGYNQNYSYSPSTSQNTTTINKGNDQVLVTHIRQSLNNNPNLVEVVPNIEVSAQNGTIILNGTVPSEQQKQAVETMVKSTAGVINVNNQLQVNLSPTASKSFDKSSRTYTGGAAAGSADIAGSASTESKGAASDSSTASSGNASSLTSTNRTSPSSPSQGLPPTSDRPDQEPRLYSTNNTGLSTSPQSSLSQDRSTAVTAGIGAAQSATTGQSTTNSQSPTIPQSGTAQSGITQSGSSAPGAGRSDNLSSAEHKDLSASADTGQKSAIYSNGPSASLTNNSPRSSLYTSAGGTGDNSSSSSNSVTQSGAGQKDLSATGNTQTRRYSGTNTNSSTTASAAASSPGAFEMNVQGASQADQAIGQKVISEMRADTSIAALLPTIRVKIDNGKATLSGTVKSQEEKLKIETAVQKVTGITSVENQLRVGGTPAPSSPQSK